MKKPILEPAHVLDAAVREFFTLNPGSHLAFARHLQSREKRIVAGELPERSYIDNWLKVDLRKMFNLKAT